MSRALDRDDREIRLYEQRREEFMAYCEPWTKLKLQILSISLPSITLYPDGHIETKWEGWAKDALDACDKGIAEVREMLERKWHRP